MEGAPAAGTQSPGGVGVGSAVPSVSGPAPSSWLPFTGGLDLLLWPRRTCLQQTLDALTSYCNSQVVSVYKRRNWSKKGVYAQFCHKNDFCIIRSTESNFSFCQSCWPFYVKVAEGHVAFVCLFVSGVLRSASFCLNVHHCNCSWLSPLEPLSGWDVVLSDLKHPICS